MRFIGQGSLDGKITIKLVILQSNSSTSIEANPNSVILEAKGFEDLVRFCRKTKRDPRIVNDSRMTGNLQGMNVWSGLQIPTGIEITTSIEQIKASSADKK